MEKIVLLSSLTSICWEDMDMRKKATSRAKIIRELIQEADAELDDKELMRLLISQKVTTSSEEKTKESFGQRAADAVARFTGSWMFIFSFLGCMALWMIINILLAANAFDGYPFILLNLVLSCLAAIQAPLIMMSQNRQEAKDRIRAENDYRINLKSELIVDDLHVMLTQVLENQKKLSAELEALRAEQKPK